MAGVAAAFHLAARRRMRGIVLVDEREPLTLTSDKGTEAYRNWWPGPDPTMLRFVSRSIDLLEQAARESGNVFRMNRRGYVFLTAEAARAVEMERTAAATCALGAGELRRHPGPSAYEPSPAEGLAGPYDGADLLLDPAAIHKRWPFLSPDVAAAVHVRRCGWICSRALGRWLLESAIAQGVALVRDRVVGVDCPGGRVQGVRLESGGRIETERLVIAAGPLLKQAAGMLGVDLPVHCELHGKMAIEDRRSVVPRDAPLMIWNDPIGRKPAGVHFRTREEDGRPMLLVIWTYETGAREPAWPMPFASDYAEVLLRGLSRMIPGLSAYFGHERSALVDGGYYCKTAENRPLIGPLPVAGAYSIAALSGFGVMASQAAAELLAAHIAEARLPDYASSFLLSRYDDAAYRARLPDLAAAQGQL